VVVCAALTLENATRTIGRSDEGSGGFGGNLQADSAGATVYYPHGESGRVGILGANSTQAVGVLAFLLAFTFLPIGIMTSGAIYYLLAIALLVVSVIIFAKCKPLEHQEN
jgi:hypothetical protein